MLAASALAVLLVLPSPGAAASAPAGAAPDADAFWLEPLQSRDQFPIMLLFLGFEPERAVSLGRGETSCDLDLSLSNIIKTSYVSAPDPSSDHVILDYEWWRVMPRFALGLGGGWEASLSLPLYYRSGGFLDSFISQFHEAFGFSDSVRRNTPNDLFRYELVIGGVRVIGPLDPGWAVGDLVLALKKSWNFSGTELGLRAAIKAPTGSATAAAGSGGFDLGLGAMLSGVGRHFGYTVNAAYYVLGPSSIPRLVPLNYISFMAGLEWLLSGRFALIAQVDFNSRFIDSLIPLLDHETGQLTAGFRWRLAERLAAEFRLSEDLATTNPDFTFGLRFELFNHRSR